MSSGLTDRRNGLLASQAIKTPVKAATTAALAALSGLLVVDGYQTVDGDRVLVKDQADQKTNGIYNAASGAWARAKDADGNLDWVQGTLVRCLNGNANGDAWFQQTTGGTIAVGTSNLVFSRLNVSFVTLVSAVAAAGQTLFNLGTTYQIGSQALQPFVNGLRQRLGADYNETSSSSVTFTYGLQAGDEVDFYIGQQIGNLQAAAASAVAITDAGDFFLGVTVEAALQELVDAITVDNGDANAILTWGSSTPVQRWNTALTANRTATLSTNNAKEGAHFICVRGSGATGNFGLAIGALATLRAPGEWCEVRYDSGTGAWVLEKYGILPSAEILGMSADNADASANLTVGSSFRTQRWGTAFTAERSAALQAVGTYTGARFRIARLETATGNFSLSVTTGGTTLARLAPGQWCDVEYTGSAWILVARGELGLGRGTSALIEFFDDFDGWTMSPKWDALTGTDPAVQVVTVLADQIGGVGRLITGADAGGTMALNGSQMNAQLNWRSSQGGLAWEARVALSAITGVALFIGLTDQDTVLEMPFTLAAGNVLTSNATDAVGVLFDTNADTDNWWLVGVAADIDAAKQNSAVAPVAGAFETWRIELDANGTATFYRNGTLIGAAMASSVTPAAKLTPVVAGFARGAASRNIDVDFVRVQAQRQ